MPDSSSFPPFPPLSALSRPNSDSPPFTEKDGLACTQQHVQVASCRNTRQYYCTCRLPASSSKLQRSLLKLRPGPLPSAPCALLPSAYLPAPANESAVRGTRVVHEAKTLLDRRTCRPPVPAPTSLARLPGGRCSALTSSGQRGHVDRRGDMLGCHTSPVPGNFVCVQQSLVAESERRRCLPRANILSMLSSPSARTFAFYLPLTHPNQARGKPSS